MPKRWPTPASRPTVIGYLEAHGTGTAQGDPIEVAALTQAFRTTTNRRGFCAIGSLKANIGHLDIASGVAGFIKTMLVVEHGKLPPTVHFNAPNPQIDFETSPFFVNRALTEWSRGETPRRAGVSAFGMGGTNAHIVLQEPPVRERVEAKVERPVHVLALSAKSDAALGRLADRYLNHLDRESGASLADICFTAGAGRAHFEHRAIAEVTSVAEARQALAAIASRARVSGLSNGVAAQSLKPGIAFLFTGQGAQYVGMASQLYRTQPTFRNAIDLCESILGSDLEPRLVPLLLNGTSAQLDATRFTQPALFAIGYALSTLWRSWGIEPTAVLGHSIGELTAATVAGVFDLEHGLKLVAARGRMMQSLPPGGGMAAIMADERRVSSAIAGYAATVSIAAVNGPEDTVIAGSGPSIDAIVAQFERDGVEVHRLQVSHAFHSPLVDPVLDEFERAVEKAGAGAPAVDLVSNVTGRFLEPGQTLGAPYWRRHAREAVRFADGLEALRGRGYRIFLEIGPHPTLIGIGRRSTNDESLRWLPSLRRGRDDWRQLLETLRELYTLGADVDWDGFDRDYPRRRVIVPTYPFERVRHWIEPKRAASPAAFAGESEPTPLAAGGGYETVWHPHELSDRAAAARTGLHVVFAEDRGVVAEVVRLLKEEGAPVVTVRAGESYRRVGPQQFSVNAEAPADFDRLLNDIAADENQTISTVIHAWSTELQNLDGDSLRRAQEQTCASALHLTQALVKSRQASAPRLCLITAGAQSISKSEKPAIAQVALLGLARTISAEHPEFRSLRIDVDPLQPLPAAAEAVCREIRSSQPDDEIAFRDGRRYVASLRCATPSVAVPPSFSADATHLITGGLGGVGLKLAEWMVARGARHLVLVGRRAPSERVRAVLDKLTASGARVSVVQADVSREEDVRRVIADIESTGPALKSVMHAAGVLAGGLVLDQRWPRFAGILKPKVDGAWHLHRMTRNLPLDHFVMFSSIASVTGLVGYGDYAAANAFLDALAHYRRAESLPGLTVNWGPWAETGMAQTLGGREERRHFISYIDPGVALTRLGQALVDGATRLIAVDIDWKKFNLQRSLSFESRLFGAVAPASGDIQEAAVENAPREPGADILVELADAPSRQRHAVLLRFLESRATTVLGIDPSQGIDPGRSLRDLGLDSLQALELRLAIATKLARPLPATLLFDHPTLKALADHLLRELGYASAQIQAESHTANVDTRARQIAELEQLTQEEAEALLLAELTGSHSEGSDGSR